MYISKRIQQCFTILSQYKGGQPFTPVLKNYFRQNTNMGGRDRKEAAALCYALLRLENFRPLHDSFEKHAAWAVFLCMPAQDKWLQELVQMELLPEACLEVAPEYRMEFFLSRFPEAKVDTLFPAIDQVGALKDKQAFINSHLHQPLLWFRVKKKRVDLFQEKLKNENVPFRINDNAFGLPNGFDLNNFLSGKPHAWGEVQDLSSQQVTGLLKLLGHEKVWDVCAASGGKSLALMDEYPQLNVYVSDVRGTILENLLERFRASGGKLPYTAKADLSNPLKEILFEGKNDRVNATKGFFNTLVLDVPCTGSGTWARNPEFTGFFDPKTITEFSLLQRKIVKNSLYFLQAGGQLLYITCSVYREENEENIIYLQTLGLELVDSRYFEGYTRHADTMFAALFKKL